MMKSLKLLTVAVVIFTVAQAEEIRAASVSIGHALAFGGSTTTINNIVADRADGSTNAGSVSASDWNTMDGASLAATYDVILFGCCSNITSYDFTWTKMTSYMNAGGSIIWENPYDQEFSGAASGVTLSGISSPSISGAVTTGPFDTGVDSYANSHFSVLSYNSDWTPWLTASGRTLGVYGTFGAGTMIISGPDNFLHANKGGSLPYQVNQYNLAYSMIGYIDLNRGEVVSQVPIPAALPLLMSALGFFGFMGWRRKRMAAA